MVVLSLYVCVGVCYVVEKLRCSLRRQSAK